MSKPSAAEMWRHVSRRREDSRPCALAEIYDDARGYSIMCHYANPLNDWDSARMPKGLVVLSKAYQSKFWQIEKSISRNPSTGRPFWLNLTVLPNV
jgi:hypothetical protein